MEKKRIEWIDTLKGFAIILVVIGHIADGYMDADLFPSYSRILRDIFNGTYMFHMALFFLLSGMTYCIAYAPKGGSDPTFTKQRFKDQVLNLLFLYVLYCLVNWCFKLALSGFVNKPVAWTDILFIWGKPIYQNWYFYVLIVFYLLFRIKAINQIGEDIQFVLLLLLSLASGFVDTQGWLQVQSVLFYALFFWLGIQYIRNREYFVFKIPATLLSVLLSIVLIYSYWNHERMIYQIPVVNTFVALGITLGLLYIFSNTPVLKEKKGLLNYIGKHSLEIYVIHSFITAGNRTLLPMIGIHEFWSSFILNLIISVSVSLLISWAAKKLGLWEAFFAPYRMLKKWKTKRIVE